MLEVLNSETLAITRVAYNHQLRTQRRLKMPDNIITIRNRQVLLNGQPFQFQGIDYAPTPIGQNPNDWPNGDYFTSDYSDIYSRDLPLMREMGINTIKVYAWNISADHSDFLTKAYNGGTNPIYVLLTSYIEA